MFCLKGKKRIAMVCMLPYPEGQASTVRIHSYCKALAEDGHYVKVFILTPLSHNDNIHSTGVFENVHYEYILGPKWKGDKSKLFKLATYFRSLISIKKKLTDERIDCILTYHNELFFNLTMKLYATTRGIPLVIDRTEYPYHFSKKNWLQRKIEYFQISIYDGIITISKELFEFYSKYNRNVFFLPMSVNPYVFEGLSRNNVTNDYIAVVFGVHNRDGLSDSIKAYIDYLERCPIECRMSLYLVGNFSLLLKMWPQLEELKRVIYNSKYKGRVEVLGEKPNKEVLSILKNARCLLSTPVKYTSGGFPTKLGEYLLSGNPVVITKAGEIEHYLTNRKNAYLCEPGNIRDISDTLLYVAENKIESERIGKEGRRLAMEKFNAANYTSDIMEFINSLKN